MIYLFFFKLIFHNDVKYLEDGFLVGGFRLFPVKNP